MWRLHAFILLMLLGFSLVIWSLAFVLHETNSASITTLPTRVRIPTETASHTPTVTASPTVTLTLTPSDTVTPTRTPQPTQTATLSTRVLEIYAEMPGVRIIPTATGFPAGTILLPAPPNPVEPLPDATYAPPPYSGWYSFESDHPALSYSTPWEARQVQEASRGQYHRSEDVTSSVTFRFEGEGLRVRYVAASNMGAFDVMVDGSVIDTVDAYALERHFPGTRVYTLNPGAHTLIIRSAMRKHPSSSGYAVGLDAIQVFCGSPNTLILPPPDQSLTPMPSPQPASDIRLVSAPPTVQATPTLSAPEEVRVSVVIAYDENGNRAVDPAEGVAGISVRLVEVGTNRAIGQAFTNASGFASLSQVTDAAVQVVVPYFGQVWAVSGDRERPFTLLLDPGTQPGLIP